MLRKSLLVVFCGTAVGRQSAERRAYYAGRGNRFWSTLASVGLTETALQPAQYGRLLDFGIGLTDLAKRTAGMDRSLRGSDFDVAAFTRRIQEYAPLYVAFNGKRAARIALQRESVVYGLQREGVAGASAFVLPSTSGLAARWWDEKPWRDLAHLVAAARGRRSEGGA